MELLRRARSLLALFLTLATFPIGVVPFYLLVVPLAWLRPAWRPALVTAFMRGMSASILGALSVGGASFRRRGQVPTRGPVLIVANHQSLTDICQVVLLSGPFVPAFVTRRRYQRWIPLVSPCVRMAGCPIVDPVSDARGAVRAVRRGARELKHGLLIFAEGHRSRDGELRPFKTAGLRAALEERRMPVWLVVSDGFWRARRLVDFVFQVHRLNGESRVIGPLEPPAGEAELDDFVASLQGRVAEELAGMRVTRRDA
jgi:1-acyl-sn-glycerol-3-phosphate acyltransferase